MTWFKLSDGAAFHRKVLAAGNEAAGAVWRAGAWSSAPDNLTDGYVPPAVARSIAAPKVWARARAAGLTDAPSDGRPGEQIHDYGQYNPSAEQVKAEREATRVRVDGWRNKRRSERASNTVGNTVTGDDVTPYVQPPTCARSPVPSRPGDPDPPKPPAGGEGAKGRAKARKSPEIPLPPDWKPSAAALAWGAEHGFQRHEVDREAEKFRNHADQNDRRAVRWDAAFGNWLLGAEERRGPGQRPLELPDRPPPGTRIAPPPPPPGSRS